MMKRCAVESGSYLVRDVWSRIADIAIHLAHDSNVFVAVQQGVLVIFHAITATMCRLVGFKAGV